MFNVYTKSCQSCENNYSRGIKYGIDQFAKSNAEDLESIKYLREALDKDKRDWEEYKATYTLKILKEYLHR